MRIKIGVVALTAGLLAGCESTVTGNEGNFQFSYWADDRVNDFNKPIAVGAKLDLSVDDVGAQQPITITDASTSDSAVLVVDTFEGNQVTVEAVGDGEALLEVTGDTSDRESLSDSVNLLARVPEVLELWHSCQGRDGDTNAYYMTGQGIWISWDMTMENEQPVIGYGYYPYTQTGESITQDTTESTGVYLKFDTASAPGSVTLTSDIDSTVLQVEVVDPTAIDGVMDPVAGVLEDIDAGDSNPFYVLPSVGDVPVCQANVSKTVESDTPTICSITESQAPIGDPNSNEFGWFTVTGESAGTCLFTVSYPEGDSGNGVSEQFSFEIQP